MKRSLVLAVLTSLLSVTSVSALNNRSAVSINGLDTNPCTTTSPCRSFGAAIAQTNAGGEVIALDTAGYGPFTVSTAMTVSGAPGVHAAITVTSGDGITVNASGTDMVTLRNLMLIGTGVQSGVSDLGSAETRVLNCTLTGFHNNGIFANNGRLTVDHCAIFDSDNAIDVAGLFTPVRAVITNSLLETFTTGVSVNSDATVQITNCTIVGGSSVGVGVASGFGTGALAARAMIESSTLSYNTTAIQVIAAGGNNSAVVYIAQDVISFSPTGVSASGGVVMSYGNNRFAEVSTIGPLGVIGLQ